jgi:hypothetical protein
MSSLYLEPKDIIAIKQKYPKECILKILADKTRKNKNEKQPTYYIPIVIKNLAGKYVSCNLKFGRQIITSNAKIPFGVDSETAKDVRISYRRIKDEDLEGTEYDPSKYEDLKASNKEFIEALDIIADEAIALCKTVLKSKSDKYKINKNKTINSFRQTHREATEDEVNDKLADEDDKIKLETPIYRLKLPADPNTKKLGYFSDQKGHTYNVFDMKKASQAAKNSKAPQKVVAKIKTPNGYVDLDVNNAKHFISYMSLTGGVVNFDCICISKSGLSQMQKIRELHVWKHKSMSVPAIDNEDIQQAAEYGNNNEDEEEVNLDEPVETKTSKSGKSKSAKSKSRNLKKMLAADSDEEPDSNDSDEEPEAESESDSGSGSEQETKKSKKPAKKSKVVSDESDEEPKKSKKPTKPSKKSKVVSDDEEEQNEDEDEDEEQEQEQNQAEQDQADQNEDQEENEQEENEDQAQAQDQDNEDNEQEDQDNDSDEESVKPKPKPKVKVGAGLKSKVGKK